MTHICGWQRYYTIELRSFNDITMFTKYGIHAAFEFSLKYFIAWFPAVPGGKSPNQTCAYTIQRKLGTYTSRRELLRRNSFTEWKATPGNSKGVWHSISVGDWSRRL